ncbi:MAG: propanediol utilization protein [Saprospiraceae bacterium]|nr:propanediol utilization protein [Saprospiraceae bacterium]
MLSRLCNTLFLTFIFMNFTGAQIWVQISKESLPETGVKDIQPEKYALYTTDDQTIKTLLWSAQSESIQDVRSSETMLVVGLPDYSTETFRIVRYEMMEAPLSSKYNDFGTFYGVATSGSLRNIRIDYTIHGFRAVIISPDQDHIFIDHYQRGDKNTRIVYYKNDYKKKPSWGCNFVSPQNPRFGHGTTDGGLRIGDCQLRSYRLAQATTGEYSLYHGNTPASVMSAVITAINRINQVYEAEVAVRLILVGNTDQIFYYNSATDPFTNGNGGTMLAENQTTCDNIIGSANYDIGHVFSTGGGGVAYLGSVCNSSIKAGGVTGSSAPVGDPFTIDYVAHEMGHQFGGNHTQYNNCNRNDATAMEPGSASTIMGYAGICNPDVQTNSDAYFHAKNLDEIKTFINTGSGCETFVGTFSNSAPVVTAQGHYTIPKSTPFVLTLTATDADNDPMTYCWDQMNAYSSPSQTMPPVSTNTSGPVFRSLTPTTNPSRYFPNLATVISGSTSNTWEVVPSVGRTLNFRGVVRDFTGVAGCNSEINSLNVTTVAAAGPFLVTSHNNSTATATAWVPGETKTITWNVAGTTANGINCANVNILMSFDGGYTYPTVLSTAVANDGSQDIIVPSTTTTTGRIMVKANGNIFFDINNSNITISEPTVSFNLSANPQNLSICVGQNTSTIISVTPTGGFSAPVTLSVTGLPSGSSATFSPNPVTPGSTSTLSLSNLSISGNYTAIVTGVSGSLSKTSSVSLTINPLPGIPVLSSPANAATNVNTLPALTWAATTNVVSYTLQIAYDNTFQDILLNTSTTSTSYQVASPLYGLTTFYWRVRGINACGTNSWSTVRSFETEPCWNYTATNVPVTIPGVVTSVYSYMTIPDKGTLTDVNIIDLQGTHEKIFFTNWTLKTPDNTIDLFWSQPCSKNDSNFNIKFDDASSSGTWPCPPVDGLTYIPTNPLSALNTHPMKGIWNLQIENTLAGYTGSLQSWALKNCANNFCRLTVDHTRASGPGSLKAAIDCATDGDTIRFVSSIMNDTIFLGNLNLVTNKHIFIQSDITKNIHIMSTSSNPTLVNNAPVSNQVLKIKGLHIHSSNANIGAINNLGNLILEDVFTYKFAGNSTATINSGQAASTTLSGNCKVLLN